MKLRRYDKNPILTPRPDAQWEDACTCNPAAWYDGQKVYLLYRAGTDSTEHPIYLGLAESTNGFDFERVSDEPVFGPSKDSFDGGCIEDPRIIKFGDTYFVTYATRMFYPGSYWTGKIPLNGHNPDLPEETPRAIHYNFTRSALAATKDFRQWYRLGPITPASVDDRDAIIFPEKVNDKFVMLHRPGTWCGNGYKCEKPSIWISFADDMLCWNSDELLAVPEYDWEQMKIGGSTPPIKTERGWLTLYHGVDEEQIYRTGVMMLDLDDPRKIIARVPEPVLEPEEDYECKGLIPNVVFPCGNVVIGDQLFVYYGGADTTCCVATAPFKEFVDFVLSHPWKG